MNDTKEKSLKKINFVVGKESKDVEKSIQIILEKPVSEILSQKLYEYPEDKEAYLKELI